MELLLQGAARLGVVLSERQQQQFRTYHEELLAWNRRMNLTAITGYEEVQAKHFLDSLTVAVTVKNSMLEQGSRAIDVGSGAGLPGLPLKIAFPAIHMTLLDSTHKKTQFLRHVVERLGLQGVDVVAGRAEEVGQCREYRESFSLVLSRALARLPSLVELMLPLCAVGGTVVAFKKGDIAAEVAASAYAIGLLGGELQEVKELALPELGEGRLLVVISKVTPTPDGYPRRPGMPAKRPILKPGK
ncbi:MAG: 16S rRNA (guanine(527)-N(7))-methyltransferase RsmG [Chloroflexota bacterium]